MNDCLRDFIRISLAQPESRPLSPLIQVKPGYWENAEYSVTDRGNHMMIVNADQSARHDWRDFQAIKSTIWGAEVEAVEVYPAESRVVDPSNAFFLWRYPRKRKPFGAMDGRRVLQVGDPRQIAPQRPIGTEPEL